MALIKCPECKKKISDQCENCPNCGYPIKANITPIETNLSKGNVAKPFFKRWWFWTVVGVVLAALVLGAVLLVNCNTKPKLDKAGNPVFIELTNEVYTNADKYKGYHINIKGKVFQVMGDNGTSKGIQIWLDPEICEQNLMISYNTDVDVKQGDYISCSGYIDSVTKYKNAYDAELHVPLILSTDLRKATYIDVMAPTTETITPQNLQKESKGYTVSVSKVEFSEKETRIYVTVTNNGKATLYIGDSIIIQNGKQYSSITNYDADYDEIPYEIVKGASSTGVIVFPAINLEEFELSFDIHSDDFDENLGEYIFEIRKENSTVKEPEAPTEIITPENLKQEKYGYSITIDKIEFYNEETRIYLIVANNGKTLLYVDSDSSVILQEGKQYNTTHNYNADYDELPYEIIKGATVSGVIAFPKLSSNDFELTIDLHSDDYDEEFERLIFKISKNPLVPPETEPPKQEESNTTNPPTNTNNAAIVVAKSYINAYECVTPNALRDHMKSNGYTDTQINYAMNSEELDWTSDIKDIIWSYNFEAERITVTNCIRCYHRFYGEYQSCQYLNCGGGVNWSYYYGYSRADTIRKLLSVGYSQVDVEAVMKEYEYGEFIDEKDFSDCITVSGTLCEHSWSSPTCQTLSICSYCGETTGDYAEHEYSQHKCIYCGEEIPWTPPKINCSSWVSLKELEEKAGFYITTHGHSFIVEKLGDDRVNFVLTGFSGGVNDNVYELDCDGSVVHYKFDSDPNSNIIYEMIKLLYTDLVAIGMLS